ncbi:MAG: hypothetical protein OXD54_00410 [Candidatus Poribacteria bacterium]|nr:hypothetical protein [Candidatus Poribacteria bacterium]
MNIQLKIIAVALLLIISAFVVGCAPKLTEEQALAESQAISDFIYNSSVANQKALQKLVQKYNLSINTTVNPITLPPIKKVKNKNKRLVLLNPRESLRWLRAYGFKIDIMRYSWGKYKITISRKNKSYSRSGPRKFSKIDNPQYLQIGNSKIRMTDVRLWDGAIWITDQYDKIRVLTYE